MSLFAHKLTKNTHVNTQKHKSIDDISSSIGGTEESHPCRSGGDAAVPEERDILLSHGQGEFPRSSAGDREYSGVHRRGAGQDQPCQIAQVKIECAYGIVSLKIGKIMFSFYLVSLNSLFCVMFTYTNFFAILFYV